MEGGPKNTFENTDGTDLEMEKVMQAHRDALKGMSAEDLRVINAIEQHPGFRGLARDLMKEAV